MDAVLSNDLYVVQLLDYLNAAEACFISRVCTRFRKIVMRLYTCDEMDLCLFRDSVLLRWNCAWQRELFERLCSGARVLRLPFKDEGCDAWDIAGTTLREGSEKLEELQYDSRDQKRLAEVFTGQFKNLRVIDDYTCGDIKLTSSSKAHPFVCLAPKLELVGETIRFQSSSPPITILAALVGAYNNKEDSGRSSDGKLRRLADGVARMFPEDGKMAIIALEQTGIRNRIAKRYFFRFRKVTRLVLTADEHNFCVFAMMLLVALYCLKSKCLEQFDTDLWFGKVGPFLPWQWRWINERLGAVYPKETTKKMRSDITSDNNASIVLPKLRATLLALWKVNECTLPKSIRERGNRDHDGCMMSYSNAPTRPPNTPRYPRLTLPRSKNGLLQTPECFTELVDKIRGSRGPILVHDDLRCWEALYAKASSLEKPIDWEVDFIRSVKLQEIDNISARAIYLFSIQWGICEILDPCDAYVTIRIAYQLGYLLKSKYHYTFRVLASPPKYCGACLSESLIQMSRGEYTEQTWQKLKNLTRKRKWEYVGRGHPIQHTRSLLDWRMHVLVSAGVPSCVLELLEEGCSAPPPRGDWVTWKALLSGHNGKYQSFPRTQPLPPFRRLHHEYNYSTNLPKFEPDIEKYVSAAQ